MMNEKQQQLVLAALKSTDSYLGVLKDAEKKGGSEMHIHDFTQHYTNAHNALTALNKINQHEPYMKEHVGDMIKVANDEDTSLADEPYSHGPSSGGGDVDEDWGGERSYQTTSDYTINPKSGRKQKTGKIYFYTQTDPEAERDKAKRKREIEKNRQMAAGQPINVSEVAKILNEKSLKSDISVSVLLEVYSRAIDNNNDPMIDVNSYIIRGKTYNENKDLHDKENEITELDIDYIIDLLEWEDIQDLFEEDLEEELDEGISATSRLKKSQRFKMTSVKRQMQKNIKLNRSADLSTIKNRAKVAARRALMKKFLKGRKKSQLSAQEKDRIESQIRNMKSIVNMMSQKIIPKVQTLQRQRLSGRGKK